jgi:excisionase family DNA binding protein
MTESTPDLADMMLERLVDEVAGRLAVRVAEVITSPSGSATPWLTTAEAIQYTRLPDSTFRKLVSSGKIPSHGGRTKLFYRPELDETLLTYSGIADEDRQLKQAS